MLFEWIKSQFLGHKNVEDAYKVIKNALQNRPITAPCLDDLKGTVHFQCADFAYRIADTVFYKGASTTLSIVPDSGTILVDTSKYAAFAVLIDADGAITTKRGDDAASKAEALADLQNIVTADDLEDKALVGVLVISGKFNAGVNSMSLGTNVDFYSFGRQLPSAGSLDLGDQLLAAL